MKEFFVIGTKDRKQFLTCGIDDNFFLTDDLDYAIVRNTKEKAEILLSKISGCLGDLKVLSLSNLRSL